MAEARRQGSSSFRTSVRLSLQYSFLYSVLSAFVFALAYWFTQYEVRDWVLDQMRGDAETLSGIYVENGSEAFVGRVDALAEISFENVRIFQLRDANGSVISGNLSNQFDGTVPEFMLADDLEVSGIIDDEVERYWMRQDSIGPYLLIQGSADHIEGEILEALGLSLIAGYLAVVILGLIVGVRIGRITEQRIMDISGTLTNVSSGNLDARIPAASSARDDLSRVSVEINAMLDQIKRLLESQEQISNDIAHDMRTPLQRLRQRLEALRDASAITPEDVTASLEQTEEIIRTFNALLRIAQIEAGDRRDRFQKTDLGQIITNVIEVFEPTADDEGIALSTQFPSEKLEVIGDRSLLTQMVSNLLENAVKYCPTGSSVKISVHQTFEEIIMRVADDGHGIDQLNSQRVFQRFFREEKSRNSPGNGLGLALVKAIAEMHHATIGILESERGATFEVRFPR